MQTSLSRLQIKTFLTFKKKLWKHILGPAFTLVSLHSEAWKTLFFRTPFASLKCSYIINTIVLLSVTS